MCVCVCVCVWMHECLLLFLFNWVPSNESFSAGGWQRSHIKPSCQQNLGTHSISTATAWTKVKSMTAVVLNSGGMRQKRKGKCKKTKVKSGKVKKGRKYINSKWRKMADREIASLSLVLVITLQRPRLLQHYTNFMIHSIFTLSQMLSTIFIFITGTGGHRHTEKYPSTCH